MSDTPSSLTPEEQSAFEEMQADDTAPPSEAVEGQAPDREPEADTEQPDGSAEPQGDQRQRMVQYSALHEERERRKKIEQERTEERREYERRFNQLLERLPQAQPQPQQPNQGQQQLPPLPDPEKDLAGFLVERQNRMEAGMRQLVQHVLAERQQNQQQTQQQQQIAQIQNAAQFAEAQYGREHPDYTDAANYLVEIRHKELELGGERDPARRLEIIRSEALGLAYSALQDGRDPAKTIHEMAKLRGFKSPAQNGATPGQKLQQIANGQEQSRTTGNMRGGAPRQLSAEAIMNMNPKEFDAFMKKATPEQKAAVFGD